MVMIFALRISAGITSSIQIFTNILWRCGATVWPPWVNNSGGIPSGPALSLSLICFSQAAIDRTMHYKPPAHKACPRHDRVIHIEGLLWHRLHAQMKKARTFVPYVLVYLAPTPHYQWHEVIATIVGWWSCRERASSQHGHSVLWAPLGVVFPLRHLPIAGCMCGWQWPGHVLKPKGQRQLPTGPTHAPCPGYTAQTLGPAFRWPMARHAIPQCQNSIVTKVHVSMPRVHSSDVEVRILVAVISTTASPPRARLEPRKTLVLSKGNRRMECTTRPHGRGNINQHVQGRPTTATSWGVYKFEATACPS